MDGKGQRHNRSCACDLLMNLLVREVKGAAVKESQDPVLAPAAVSYFPIMKEILPGKAVGLGARICKGFPHCRGSFLRQIFIGIQNEHPPVFAGVNRILFLAAESLPLMVQDGGAVLPGEFHCSIGTAAVDDNCFIGN